MMRFARVICDGCDRRDWAIIRTPRKPNRLERKGWRRTAHGQVVCGDCASISASATHEGGSENA